LTELATIDSSSTTSSIPFFARLVVVLFVDLEVLLRVALALTPAFLPLVALVLFVAFTVAS
jgi:hypothetical protein